MRHLPESERETPPLTARNATATRRLLLAYLVGILGYGVGLPFSAVLDLLSGEVVDWTLAILGVGLSFLWGDKRA